MSTDRDIAAQPLDDFDSTILDTIAEVFRAADPVPAGLAEDIKFALTVQAMHAEVAELQRVGAESALARSEYTQTQTLTFSAEALSVMVTMSPIDADEVRVDGWVTGHDSPVRVEIRAGDADHHGGGRRRRPVHGRPGTAGPRALRVPARGRCPTRHHAHRGDLRERIRRDLHDHVTRLVEEAVLANAAGAPARAEALLRRALRRLDTEADLLDDAVVLRARVHVTHAVSRVQRGDRAGAFALLDAADGLLAGARPNHVRSLAVVQRAGLHGSVGEWERTRELLEGVSLTAEVAPRTRCLLHLNLGLTYQFLGRYHDSDVRLRRAHQDAVALGFPDLAAAALHNRGRLQMLLGNLPRALALMEQARELGGDLLPPAAVLDRARVLSEAGLIDQAMEALEEGEQAARSGGIAHDVAEADLERARLALLRQEHADARGFAARAERRFARGSETAWAVRASLLRLQAELLLGRNPSATATTLSALADGPAGSAPSVRRPRCSQRRRARWSGTWRRPADSWLDPRCGVRPPSHSGSSARWRWPSCTTPRVARTSSGASCGAGRTGWPSSRHGTPRSTRELPLPCTPAGCATPTSTSPSPAAPRRRSSMQPSCGVASRNAFPHWSRRTTWSWPASPPMRAGCTPRRSTPPTRPAEPHWRLRHETRSEPWRAATGRSRALPPPHAEERPVTVAALRPLLDQARSGLLSLFIHRGLLWAVTVTPSGAKLTRVPEGARVVEAAARLRADLATRRLARGTALEEVIERSMLRTAASLGEVLAPVLPRAHRLVIIPSASLASLPWRLVPGIRGRIVTVAPSATFWARRSSSTRHPDRSSGS